jgi:predicted permease
MLRRNPGFTVVALLALALGIGVNSAVFSVVEGALLRPLPFPQPDRLYFLSSAAKNGPFGPPHISIGQGLGMSDHMYPDVRARVKDYDAVAAFDASQPAALSGMGDAIRVGRARVTTEFLNVLEIYPALGRGFQAGDDRPGNEVAILSDKSWRGLFQSDHAVVGKRVVLDGVSHTVIGVMPAGFEFPPATDVWTARDVVPVPRLSLTLNVIGRLKPGISPQQAEAEFRAISASLNNNDPRSRDLATQLFPLKEMLVSESRSSLLIFWGAAAFVLLIACANVANLLLMRAGSRTQEAGVRLILGARPARLIRQFLTENLVLSLAGGVIGWLLALWLMPALLALAPAGKIPRLGEVHMDPAALAFTLGLSLLSGCLFGLAPAFQAARKDLGGVAKLGSRTYTGAHEWLRGALVVAEMSLAVILLMGAGLLLKSFLRIQGIDPGFHPDHVAAVTVDLPQSNYRTPESMQAFHRAMLTKLAAMPGIAAAAVNYRPLGGLLIMGDFHPESARSTPPGSLFAVKLSVSSGYFQAMGIRLLAGRDFTERDDSSSGGVLIVSKKIAEALWPGEDAVGQRVSMQEHPKPDEWLTIVGVVDNVRQGDLKKAAGAALYQPYSQVRGAAFLGHMSFLLRTRDRQATAALPAIRSALREVDPSIPPQSLSDMQDLIAATTAEPLFETRLLGAFSLMALALAALGIYSVLAYSVVQRTREIGIRMALGANSREVTGMVMRRTVVLIAVSLALGGAGAFGVTRVLSSVLFEVQPTDPATAVGVMAILTAAALLAGWLPARRAARVDPMAALRYD